MPDGIVPTEQAFREIQRTVHRVRGDRDTQSGESPWNPRFVGGGSTNIVRFQIASADCSAGTATVDILARPCGKTSVPDEDSNGQLSVVDAIGCFLDEPDSDLVDRKGYAQRLESDTGDCQWEITALCAKDECV